MVPGLFADQGVDAPAAADPDVRLRAPQRLQDGQHVLVSHHLRHARSGSRGQANGFPRLPADTLGRMIESQWTERGLCAVELKDGGEFIGRAGLNYWQPFDEVEVGWTLKAEAWGHGYATEAARACLEWGFATPSRCTR
ncbi:GNAT family N-acetyltransferase [Streptomyces prunicolor]|uniref:GNAT family N-acetyltransferase n=1 Tax=Streptomyces prunicolor TaxID=67348 RepID=UPI002B1DC76E|nr:GNAT family N-acetyltransferase [Streptomyces prunicolor]